MADDKPPQFPLHTAGAPAVSERIMSLYARMSPRKRKLLLLAAQLIALETTTVFEFEDTLPQGSMQTRPTDFDPHG